MNRIHWQPLISRWIAALIFLTPAMPARAEKYSNAEHHFSMEIPAGWRPMALADLNGFNNAGAKPGAELTTLAGFTASKGPIDHYPCVVIKVAKEKKLRYATYDQIEKDLAKELNVTIQQIQNRAPDVLKNAALNEAFVDRSRNRIFFRAQADVAVLGTVINISTLNLAKEEVVFVLSYDRKIHFEKNYPIVMAMNDSFQFDEGFAYSPEEVKARWMVIAIGGLACVLFVVLGIVLLVIFATRGSRKAAKRKGSETEEVSKEDESASEE